MNDLIIPDQVETIVRIEEVLSHRTAQVSLPNGRIVFAYTAKISPEKALQHGEHHHARMVVADFSRAELRGIADIPSATSEA